MTKDLEKGFTLIELVVFVAIFSVAAIFLVSILITVTRTQLRQSSVNELNAQIAFISNTIQRLVRESSQIANEPAGVASTTLILRRASSTFDTTKIFVDPGMTAIYLQEVDQNGVTSTTVPLTNSKVKVTNFSVTKYQTPSGVAIAQIDFTLDYNTTNPQARISRSWRGAITRVSAATFDSGLVPTSDGTLNLGSGALHWSSGFFSNDVFITNGKLAVGSYGSIPSGMRIYSAGNIGFPTSSVGILMKSPNGSCYRLGVLDSGAVTTTPLSAASCAQ